MKHSTDFAVIVLSDELKKSASNYFDTPLIFSIYEVNHLNYKTVILYDWVSSDSETFLEIVKKSNANQVKKTAFYVKNKQGINHVLEKHKFYINGLVSCDYTCNAYNLLD